MVSQTDRKSDGFGIANGSQTIAVTAPDTEAATATEGRTPFTNSPSIHSHLSDARDPRAAKFWRKVKFADGPDCWEWMGEINHRGYGVFTFKGKRTTAHRVSYEIANGEAIAKGLHCGHLCHNPSCVRPDHLEPMTPAENIRQRDERIGNPASDLGRPMTSAERGRRYRAKKLRAQSRERIEAGEWVMI